MHLSCHVFHLPRRYPGFLTQVPICQHVLVIEDAVKLYNLSFLLGVYSICLNLLGLSYPQAVAIVLLTSTLAFADH